MRNEGTGNDLFTQMKDDKKKVNAVRNAFYGLNEQFEQLLQFKAWAKIQHLKMQFDMEESFGIVRSLSLREEQEQLDE